MSHVLSVSLWAHPRVSGENSVYIGIVNPDTGSSPRERGKLAELLYAWDRLGLIPA